MTAGIMMGRLIRGIYALHFTPYRAGPLLYWSYCSEWKALLSLILSPADHALLFVILDRFYLYIYIKVHLQSQLC